MACSHQQAAFGGRRRRTRLLTEGLRQASGRDGDLTAAAHLSQQCPGCGGEQTVRPDVLAVRQGLTSPGPAFSQSRGACQVVTFALDISEYQGQT